MKKILMAGLILIGITASTAAQDGAGKKLQQNRVENSFRKETGKKEVKGKFEKSTSGKESIRHQQWKRHDRKEGIGKKHGERNMKGVHKMQDRKFKKGNNKRFKNHGQRNKS